MQGALNQMIHPMPQNHFLSMNQMHSGSLPTSGAPSAGGFPSGLPNMQGHSNPMGGQMYPHGGQFNRPQGGQMQMLPGFNLYQSGSQAAGMPPLPPGPPPHSQTPQ